MESSYHFIQFNSLSDVIRIAIPGKLLKFYKLQKNSDNINENLLNLEYAENGIENMLCILDRDNVE